MNQQIRQNIHKEIEDLYQSIEQLKCCAVSVNQTHDQNQETQDQKQEYDQIKLSYKEDANQPIECIPHQQISIKEVRNQVSQDLVTEDQVIQNTNKITSLQTLSLEQQQVELDRNKASNLIESNIQDNYPKFQNKSVATDEYALNLSYRSQYEQRIPNESQHNFRKQTQKQQRTSTRDISNSKMLEQNLLYEVKFLREENKQLRYKLKSGQFKSAPNRKSDKLINRSQKNVKRKVKLPYQSDSDSDEYSMQDRSRESFPKTQRRHSLNKICSPNATLMSRSVSPLSWKRKKHCRLCDFLLNKGFSTSSCMFHGKYDHFIY